MTHQKTPPKNKLVVEKRIIDGKMRKVETYNGKVARVYDEKGRVLEDRSKKLKIILPTPYLEPKTIQEKKMDYTPEEDKPQETLSPSINLASSTISNLGSSGTIGLQLVPEEDVAQHEGLDYLQTDVPQCPECKSKNTDTLLHLENATRYKCRDCNETFATKKKIEAPKTDDIQKIESKTTEIFGTAPEISHKLDNLIHIQDISNKVDIPKVDIHNITIADNKIKIDVPKIVDKMVETTITTVKAEQQKNRIEDKKIKENKSMAEEILEEYKREQWAKKRDFEKNIEDMARVSAENKGQISGISHKIEDVEGKLGDVDSKIGNLQENFQNKFGSLQENLQDKFGNLQENLQEKLGNIKKPVSDVLGELCTGVDCIKNDVKKSQEYQQTYQQTLEKQLEHRFKELSERLQKLEEPTYVCDNCGQDDIRPLSSFCPNCGAPIHNWTDPETGMPVSGWSPYWKRMRGTIE